MLKKNYGLTPAFNAGIKAQLPLLADSAVSESGIGGGRGNKSFESAFRGGVDECRSGADYIGFTGTKTRQRSNEYHFKAAMGAVIVDFTQTAEPLPFTD